MRILVVDDHELVRRGICSVLSDAASLTICGEAIDGVDAVAKAKALLPDVVVMDISMPNMNGLDATREIKRALPETEIVIVSQHNAPEMVRQALHAGAGAYVTKATIATELLAAVATVSRNGLPAKEAVASRDTQSTPQNQSGRAKTHGTPSVVVSGPEEIAAGSAFYTNEEGTTRAFEHAEPLGTIPLQYREQIYHAIGESIDFGVWICDAKGRNLYASPSFLQLLGITQKECSEMNWTQMLHPEDAERTFSAWQECVRTGGPWEHEHRFRRADGNWHSVLTRGAPIRDAAGHIRYWAGTHSDVQGRKTIELDLHQLVKNLEGSVAERASELERASVRLRELSGTLLQTQDEERRRIARELHDGIGQLLSAMSMNMTNLSHEKKNLSDEAQQALEENSALLKQALQEIRTMSHLLHPPLLDEVGLESALRWFVDGFAERSKITVNIQLSQGFGEGLPRDLALSVFRIVQESLTNIHRHSESETALVKIQRDDEEIVLEVADSGKGISDEILAKIASGEGSGVGLRGMQERIRQFGGHLDVRSSENGAQIIAQIPIPKTLTRKSEQKKQNEPDTASVLEASATEPRPATILCIDDEAAGLLPRRLLLESAGYRVVEARSGTEGIELFRSEKIDAVILDYWMAGMKGTAVASELKAINPHVPIIVVSGMWDLPGEAVGLVDQWLVKGSHRAEKLLEALSTLLERRAV